MFVFFLNSINFCHLTFFRKISPILFREKKTKIQIPKSETARRIFRQGALHVRSITRGTAASRFRSPSLVRQRAIDQLAAIARHQVRIGRCRDILTVPKRWSALPIDPLFSCHLLCNLRNGIPRARSRDNTLPSGRERRAQSPQ